MKIIFKAVFLTTVLVSIFCNDIQAAEKKAKKAKKSVAAEETQATPASTVKPENKPAEPKKIVEELPAFNLDMSLIPANYTGHNIATIVDSLILRQKVGKKDEFETTDQYKKRIEEEYNKPIIGKLNINDMFALKINNADVMSARFLDNYHNGLTAKYNADEQKLDVEFNISQFLIRDKNYKIERAYGVHGYSYDKDSSSYVGTNAYGATVDVKRLDIVEYKLVINNLSEFNIAKKDFGETKVVCSIKLPADKAKELKNNLSLLVIYNIDDPAYKDEDHYSSATFDSPTSLTRKTHFVYSKAVDFWIYNQQTGKVIFKLKGSNKKDHLI
jgi:hypothetical protein